MHLRCVVYPFVEYGEVLAHDAFVALKELIAAREGNGPYRLVKHAAANEVIISVRDAAFNDVLIVRCYPAEAYSGKREYLGHAADGYALVVQIDDGFAPYIVLRQVAVDLVAHDVCADAFRYLDYLHEHVL